MGRTKRLTVPDEDDESSLSTVIALDPGGTTGWCVLAVHPESLVEPDVTILGNILWWTSGQFTGTEYKQNSQIIDLIECWPYAAVLLEDFILRKQLRSRELLSPVRITSVIEYELERVGRPCFKQQPSEAKNTATDDRLKNWGLYRREGGEEHARDATRHAITFLRRAKDRPNIRHRAWPSLYGADGSLIASEES